MLSFSQSAIIRGVILAEGNLPIEGVNITTSNGEGTTPTNNGIDELKIPFGVEVTVIFTHDSHKRVEQKFNLKNGQEIE
jgi:hypothetical protein